MFNFTVKEFILGGGNATPALQFYKRGFNLGGSVSPSWQDVILSGNTSLTLVNAKANGLNYLKLFGGTEQNGTPSPDNPMDIVCNNGVVKVNTTGSGKNAIDTSDTEVGYLISTVGQQPRINTSTASIVIKNAIKVSNGKKYKFLYYSNVAGNREYNIVDNNGIVTLKIGLECNVGLNEYIIEANANGYLWVTVQNGDLATVKPVTYEIGQVYTDGTQETVTVTGKNLFDKADTVIGYLTDQGVLVQNNTGKTSGFIRVQTGSVYTLKLYRSSQQILTRVCSYDSDGNFVSLLVRDPATAIGYNIDTFTADTEYIRISFHTDCTEVQLELGSTPTPYEPYFNGGSATAEMLLKVGTYQDVQEVLAGNVTRNVGVMAFNGTESWNLWSTFGYFCDFPINTAKTGRVICSISNNWNFTSAKRLLANVNQSLFPSVADWKQYLADQYANGTPVILVYPLATPTEETVTPQPLSIQAGTNIITAEGSIDNLPLEVSYKATA